MEELIYQLSPFAPAAIFVATTLDIFFLTGYMLYGFAMLSSILMMHTTGMVSAEAIVLSATTGTIVGNITNYWTGRLFGETEFIKQKLQHPLILKSRGYLEHQGLIVFMVLGRFITFTRPLYAVLLGSMQIKFSRFLACELPLALLWVTFWLAIILKGESALKSIL